ncbi:3-phenylpropionic acid transporter [Canicola haemoglobinophilus]|uniref:3-phenylpropionic acid transporter n=1 Tax=Canicola haemoglobinophilus TaxID=733 RepID=A0AB38HBG6_9PAST|nr:3-phenylpropionate MFS transporter [Canicola haemoglobinophilus]STO54723.1 3-phenylpropionic acid transporter [Canicola haemoglobinophilus]STO69705.1 3-phenylpropionic acid transporter [Canicola haemoglobinophilus]
MRVSPFSWLAICLFGYFFAYGVFVPYFPVWLKSQSYDETTIGLILASAYFFRALGGIWFSSLVKLPSQLISGLRYLAWATCALMFIAGFIAPHFWLLCILVGLFSMANSGGIPLMDTLSTTWQQQQGVDYGKARMIGSIAFAAGVVIFGYVIEMIDAENIVWILTALLVLYALGQMAIPTHPPVDPIKPTQQENTDVENAHFSFAQLLKNKVTLRLLIAISLIHGSHAAYYSYSVLYWQELNIPLQAIGSLWALSIVAEIVLFFFSSKWFSNWKVSSLFYLAAVGAVVRWGGLSIADNIAMIAFIQLLHSITFATSHYAMIRYISTQPHQAIAKLQGLYNSLAACIAIGLLAGLSSLIYPISPFYTFLTMMLIAVLAIPIIPRNISAFRQTVITRVEE